MNKLHLFFMMVTIPLFLFSEDTPKTLFQMQYAENQEAAKRDMIFKDGTSLEQLEATLKQQYPNMPNFIVANKYTVLNVECPLNLIEFDKKNNRIIIGQDCNQCDFHATNWRMLHVLGKTQEPYATAYFIQTFQLAVRLLTFYYWGIHRTKAYKNIATKIYSKFSASSLAGGSTMMLADNLKTRRADNWANAHSNIETLNGGIESMTDLKKMLQKTSIPFILEKAMAPTSPSLDSRIAKMEKAKQQLLDSKL